MCTSDLSTASSQGRAQLLHWPSLKSDEMLEKVKPTVGARRAQGDKALLEFTTRFARAQLSPAVLPPPFAPETMVVRGDTRKATAAASGNTRRCCETQPSYPAPVARCGDPAWRCLLSIRLTDCAGQPICAQRNRYPAFHSPRARDSGTGSWMQGNRACDTPEISRKYITQGYVCGAPGGCGD